METTSLDEQLAIVKALCRRRDAADVELGVLQGALTGKQSQLEITLLEDFDKGVAVDREIDELKRRMKLRCVLRDVFVRQIEEAGAVLVALKVDSEIPEYALYQQQIREYEKVLGDRYHGHPREIGAKLQAARDGLRRLKNEGCTDRAEAWLAAVTRPE